MQRGKIKSFLWWSCSIRFSFSKVSDSVYNWLTVLLGNQYLTFRAPIRVYIFNFIILGILYIVHLYTSVPYPICCIMLGLILIIRDHKQRWRCDTDNLSGNPTLKKLTTFWYSSMRSRQLNVFYHWLHMWPSGQKLDEVRLWLVFRIYADSLFNPAYEEYKQPKVRLNLDNFKWNKFIIACQLARL